MSANCTYKDTLYESGTEVAHNGRAKVCVSGDWIPTYNECGQANDGGVIRFYTNELPPQQLEDLTSFIKTEFGVLSPAEQLTYTSTEPRIERNAELVKHAVEWAFNDHGRPTIPDCGNDPIRPGVIRGMLSASSCITEAIKSAKLGDLQSALNWIATTQCHNPPAKKGVLESGYDAVYYMMWRYGGGIGSIGASPGAPPRARVTVLNASPYALYVIGNLIPKGGRSSCDESKRYGLLQRGRSIVFEIPEDKVMVVSFKTTDELCGSATERHFRTYSVPGGSVGIVIEGETLT